jgi:hypothetical protein
LRESDAIEAARHALGARLAAYRRAAGYSQAQLAKLTITSRSSVANVETGRQHVSRQFWASADAVLHADGDLTQASDAVEAAAQQDLAMAARQSGPLQLVLPGAAVGSPGFASPALAPVSSAEAGTWTDMLAAAADRAREHAARAAVTEIGPGTIEQLTADVTRLSRAYVSAPPLPLFAAMQQSLGQVHEALGRRAYPAQARDLHFLAGALCALMANASLDLGREETTDDLARAAWTHAQVIDHGPLMGWARGTQALAAIWDGRHADAIQRAEDGLGDVGTGGGRVRLHAVRARALAAHGDFADARAAITAASQARAGTVPDDLHGGLGGEFAFDDAKLAYYQALTLTDDHDPVALGHAAQAAIRLYQALPARARSYGCEALARVQLARAQLLTGTPAAAAETLAPVLKLDPQRRIGGLVRPLDTCRQLLAAPAVRRSGAARQLDRQLAAYSTASTGPSLSTEQALPRTS